MDVAKYVEKAQEAARKRNFDYAIQLYHQVLQLKPDHGEARRELRQILVRRADSKKIAKPIAAAQGVFSRLSMVTGGLGKKPEQVALAAEKYLVNDPHNRRVNLALAEALEKAGHLNSAVAVFEFLHDDPEVGDLALKKAGALYYALKQVEKALACYETVLKRSPRDSEAEKARKNLAAEGVLSSGSYDPTRSSRDLARDRDKIQERELDQRLVTSEDQREQRLTALRQALEKNPTDRRGRKELVDQLVRAKRYDDALAVVDEGLEHEPDAYELLERRGDLKVLDLEQRIREVREAAEQGDAAAKTDLVDLTREKRQFELEETERRVKAHPTDLGLRDRLGRLELEEGRLDDAIANFQHAVKDARRRVDALLGLGEAFRRKGLPELAQKQFETALEGAGRDSERLTEIQYALGALFEETGATELAIARFETIYEQDIHYRDVAQRLVGLRARRGEKQQTTKTEARHEASTPRAEPNQDEAKKPTREDDATSKPPSSTYHFKD